MVLVFAGNGSGGGGSAAGTGGGNGGGGGRICNCPTMTGEEDDVVEKFRRFKPDVEVWTILGKVMKWDEQAMGYMLCLTLKGKFRETMDEMNPSVKYKVEEMMKELQKPEHPWVQEAIDEMQKHYDEFTSAKWGRGEVDN